MFIGLPTAVAMLITFMPRATSATGMIAKGITLFLLLVGFLIIEGFICILMVSPFFYVVGFIVGIFSDDARARKEFEKRFRGLVLPFLILMSLEGVSELLSFLRDHTVTVEQEVALSPAATRERLSRGPQFLLTSLPPFLKLGLPAPQRIEGAGLEAGDEWLIHFAWGEGKPGDLRARVTGNNGLHIMVERVSDTNHISHWLDWKEAEWTIREAGIGSHVTLISRYRRLLDPAWYFKPIERYGVSMVGSSVQAVCDRLAFLS